MVQPYKMSACNGTMILGEAGYLSGKKATTNRNVFETLAPYLSWRSSGSGSWKKENLSPPVVLASSLDLGL